MDIGFLLMYVLVPVVISWGIFSGRKEENHLRLSIALGTKGVFYFYCAIANLVNYVNENVATRYVIGFTIAVAIIEGFIGMMDCISESQKHYDNQHIG